MKRGLFTALVCVLFGHGQVVSAQEGQPPAPVGPAPTESVPAGDVAAPAVQATLPGLYQVALPNTTVTNLEQFTASLTRKRYRVLEAYEADDQAHFVLHIRNNAELGQLQYDLNQRLTPMPLPVYGAQTADANYSRLQQAGRTPLIAQLTYDISAAGGTGIRESFDDFATRALYSGVSLYALTDADGNSGQLKRYQNNSYALPSVFG